MPSVPKGATTLQMLDGGSESGEVRIEGEVRERAGLGNPSPEFCWNFELQIVQSGVSYS